MHQKVIKNCLKGIALVMSLTLMACMTTPGDPNSTLQYSDLNRASFALKLKKPASLDMSEQDFMSWFQKGLFKSGDWNSITLLPTISPQVADFILDMQIDTFGVSNFVREVEYGKQEMHHFTTATRIKGRTLIRDAGTDAILWQYRWNVENYDYEAVSRFVYEDDDLLDGMNNKSLVRVVGQSSQEDKIACSLLSDVCIPLMMIKHHDDTGQLAQEALADYAASAFNDAMVDPIMDELFGDDDDETLPFPEHKSLKSMTRLLGRHIADKLPQPQ